MRNKSIEEQIRSILLNNNEWDAFDDEVEDGYVSVEYHKETLDEVIKQILSLIKKEKEEYKENIHKKFMENIFGDR